MRLYFIPPLIILLLAACSPSGKSSAVQTAEFSTAFVAMQTELAKEVDTPAPPPATLTPAINELPTSEPTASPQPQLVSGSALLDEPFDTLGENWSEALWITNYTPDVSKSKLGLEAGWLLFDLIDRSSMLYTFNNKVNEKNVILETVNQISGPGQTEAALACRANSDLSSWIDFRILYLQEFAIYRFDRSRVSKGLNPYETLVRGPIPYGLLVPGAFNKVKASCIDYQFTLEINDVRVGNAASELVNEPGSVGLGGIGAVDSSAAVYFDYLKVTLP